MRMSETTWIQSPCQRDTMEAIASSLSSQVVSKEGACQRFVHISTVHRGVLLRIRASLGPEDEPKKQPSIRNNNK